MMYAAMKATGPGTDGQDVAAIEDALCGLRQFPEYKSAVSVDLGEADLPTDDTCASRFAGSFLTIDPAPVWQRCPRTFLWWGNPYHHQRCTADPTWVQPPSDYLLPYWMARYFGWIGAGD